MKLVSFVLGIGLSALLIGCGGGGSSSTSDDGGAVSSDPDVALTRTAYTTAENVSDAVTLQSDTAGTIFTIVGGFDSDKLRIDSSTGKLTFLTTPDFENPHDQNADNIFELTIKLTAPGSETMTRITIRVLDVDESGGGAADTGPDPDVSEVVEIPVWDERPEVTIPEPADPLEGGSFTYLGDRLALPDGLTIDDVFVDDIRLKQNYKIVASTNAVTVDNYTGENQNSQDAGRYLTAGKTDIEHQTLISFDRDAILGAFGGQSGFNAKRENISRVELYLWSESGTEADLEIKKLSYAFDEESALWKHNWGFSTIATKRYYSDPIWYRVEIPVETLLIWMDNPAAIPGFAIQAAEGSGNGAYVRFSSDETSRPPSLVIHYADMVEAESPVMMALGVNFEAEPCDIQYEVTPPHPADGDRVTITATATDNRAMDYIAIKHRDESGTFRTVAYQQTDGTQNSVSVSYETTATLPNLKFAVKADDEGGRAHSVYHYAQIPVRNSGAGPELIVEENPEIKSISPKAYRFIKADGQKIDLSFKATDSDGITKVIVYIGGQEYKTFNYDGSASVVNETFTWQNNDLSLTKYSYRIQAFDRSGDYSVVDSAEEYPIRNYEALGLYANALNFTNDRGKDKFDYDPYMFYTYKEIETRPRAIHPGANFWYGNFIKKIGKGGLCYGMSATSIELAKKRDLRVENLKSTAVIPADLTQSDRRVNDYIYTKQISQLSLYGILNIYLETILRAGDLLSGDSGAEHVVNRIYNALYDHPNNLGIISIVHYDIRHPLTISAHAMVPWMVRKTDENEWRIYVYDPNKPNGPKGVQRIINEFGGEGYIAFSNVDMFPYLSVNTDTGDWSYIVAGTVYSSLIHYVPSWAVSGDVNDHNTISESLDLYNNDFDLPGIEGIHHAVVDLIGLIVGNDSGSDISVDVTSPAGAVQRTASQTALYPVPLADADENTRFYLMKKVKDTSITVSADQSDTYTLGLDLGRAMFTISGKTVAASNNDVITFDGTLENDGYHVTFSPGTGDSDFNITAMFTFGKLKNGTIIPSIKTYKFTHVNLDANSPIRFNLEEYSDALHIESLKNAFSFDLSVEEATADGENAEIIYTKSVNVNVQEPFDLNFKTYSKE